MNTNWTQFPLGIPMALASLGTIITLPANKHLHACFGILWTGLSLWHGLQHRKKMKSDAKRWPAWKICRPPASQTDQFRSTLQLRSFLEGRIRVYSPYFVNQPALQQQIEEYFQSFEWIQKAKMNPVTGSLLIEYRPEQFRAVLEE